MTTTSSPLFSEIIHSPVRLRICALMRRISVLEYAIIRDTLQLSDAHLSKNLKVLSDAGLVTMRKDSSPDRTDARKLTWVGLTEKGRVAFEGHLAALSQIADGTGETAV
jgi:DNA-binding MarR family transcriptional regulator